MKKTILLILGCIVAATAVGQIQSGIQYTEDKAASDAQNKEASFNASQNERKFAIIEIYDKVDPMDSFLVKSLITKVEYVKDGSKTHTYAPGDTARLFLPEDPSRPLKAEMLWKYADQIYDTTYTETARIDDPSTSSRWTKTNMSIATNSTKVLFNKSFSYVTVTTTLSSATIEVTCDRVEFFGERFQGHGNVKIYVDGQQVRTLYQGAQPWVTDFSRMQPSWYWVFPKAAPTSAPTKHTIKFETDPGNQYIIDMIRTLDYKLTPRK